MATAILLGSCGDASVDADEKSNSPSPEIAEAVERCGLDLSNVTFVEKKTDRYTEQYLTFERHPVLSKSGMDCLAQVLISADYGLRTDDVAFDRSYAEAWEQQLPIHVLKLAKEWIATNRPSLVVPQFSGLKADLPDFVAAVERLCNAPTGTAEVTELSNVYLPWPQEPPDEANCLFNVLTASNLNQHGIDVMSGGVP